MTTKGGSSEGPSWKMVYIVSIKDTRDLTAHKDFTI